MLTYFHKNKVIELNRIELTHSLNFTFNSRLLPLVREGNLQTKASPEVQGRLIAADPFAKVIVSHGLKSPVPWSARETMERRETPSKSLHERGFP